MKKQLCTLVVRREKIKKKHKQSIIGDNLTKQTTNNKRKIMHFSCQERKERKKMLTINHRWQSNHDMYTHAALCGRRDGCVSSEMADDKI